MADDDRELTLLTVIEPEGPGVDTVEILEAALERARAGKLSSVALAEVYRDGSINTAWSSPPNKWLLLGSITRLGQRLAGAPD